MGSASTLEPTALVTVIDYVNIIIIDFVIINRYLQYLLFIIIISIIIMVNTLVITITISHRLAVCQAVLQSEVPKSCPLCSGCHSHQILYRWSAAT